MLSGHGNPTAKMKWGPLGIRAISNGPGEYRTAQATGAPSGIAFVNSPMKIGPENEGGAAIRPTIEGSSLSDLFPALVLDCMSKSLTGVLRITRNLIGDIPSTLENRRMNVPRLL